MPDMLSPRMATETWYEPREEHDPVKPRRMTGNSQHKQYVTVPGQNCQARNSTTSFLTAATLIYAIGAGITAAAGTRLALQLILDKGFKLFSFQLPDLERPGIVIYCHYLPVSGLGNLRACCLPWMW